MRTIYDPPGLCSGKWQVRWTAETRASYEILWMAKSARAVRWTAEARANYSDRLIPAQERWVRWTAERRASYNATSPISNC